MYVAISHLIELAFSCFCDYSQLIVASLMGCRLWMRFSEFCFHRATEADERARLPLLPNSINFAPSGSVQSNTLRGSTHFGSPACGWTSRKVNYPKRPSAPTHLTVARNLIATEVFTLVGRHCSIVRYLHCPPVHFLHVPVNKLSVRYIRLVQTSISGNTVYGNPHTVFLRLIEDFMLWS